MINIGTSIKTILTDETLNNLLGGDDKVCPIIMPEEIDYPFIVYRATGMNTDDNKDNSVDIDIVTIMIIAGNYDSSVTIATRVRNLMETFTSDLINDVKLVNRQEEQNEDAFIQMLTFDVENNKKYDI